MGELWEQWWPTLVGGLLLAGGALLLWPRATDQRIEAEAPAAVTLAPAPAPSSGRPTEQDEQVSREHELEEARLRAAVRAAKEEPGQSRERPDDDSVAKADTEPVRPVQLTERSAEVRTALSQVDVELYETSWCKYCRKTRAFLEQSGIRYRAYDVEADSLAKARKSDLAPGTGVPVVVIDEQVLVGFSEAALNAAFQTAVGRRLHAR